MYMEFTIINTSSPNDLEINLLNSIVSLWENTYTKIAGNRLPFDSFHRARSVCVLHENNTVIGFGANNYFYCGIDKTTDHSYFNQCSQEFKNELISKKSKIMTIEWITINELYQKRFSKIQYSDIIMGIQIHHMKESGFDAAMGFSRMDIKTDRLAKKFGAISKGEISMFNIPCSVIYMPQELVTRHPITKTQEIIIDLYNKATNKEIAA